MKNLVLALVWLSIADAFLDTNLCTSILESFFGSISSYFSDIFIEALLTPYNIVRVIMIIGGLGGGIWFGRKGGKILYSIVSFVFAVGSLVSLLIEYI